DDLVTGVQTCALPIFPGPAPKRASLTRDYSPKDAENMTVELTTDPPQPISGFKTQMYFRVKPADGLEKYLAAWGHMLAASDDLKIGRASCRARGEIMG